PRQKAPRRRRGPSHAPLTDLPAGPVLVLRSRRRRLRAALAAGLALCRLVLHRLILRRRLLLHAAARSLAGGALVLRCVRARLVGALVAHVLLRCRLALAAHVAALARLLRAGRTLARRSHIEPA